MRPIAEISHATLPFFSCFDKKLTVMCFVEFGLMKRILIAMFLQISSLTRGNVSLCQGSGNLVMEGSIGDRSDR